MPTARRYELACWLSAAFLALGLALAPTPSPNTRAAARPITATAAQPAPHLSIYQQHCIERIVTRAANKTEEYVAGLITQLCFAPFRGSPSSAAGQALPSCDRLFSVRLTPVAKRVAGCLDA